jgi:hypothetical protein
MSVRYALLLMLAVSGIMVSAASAQEKPAAALSVPST